MNKLLYHFTVDKYDPDHETSPVFVKNRKGDRLITLTHSQCTEDLLEKLHDMYEIVLAEGRQQAKDEIRKTLGL
jgi:hypothetical protein